MPAPVTPAANFKLALLIETAQQTWRVELHDPVLMLRDGKDLLETDPTRGGSLMLQYSGITVHKH